MSIEGDPPQPIKEEGLSLPEDGLARVERSIDAVDWLRMHMRKSSMVDCADALDDAFAKSLKAYLELQDRFGTAQ